MGNTDNKPHCWVVDRNGDIIDPYFEQYDDFKKQFNCYGEPIYLKYDKMPKGVNKWLKTHKDYYKTLEENGELEDYINVPFCCIYTATHNKKNNVKSKFVVGRMGFKQKDTNKIIFMFW